MSLSERQAIFSLNVAKLIVFINEKGFKCTLGEAFRTFEQAKLYAEQGKGSANSLHCSRLAVDLHIFSKYGKYLEEFKDYEEFGVYWEKLHPDNKWGGRFPKLVDCVHFEMKKNSFGSNKFNGSIR